MGKREKRCLASHIRTYDDLEDLIFFITRYFNHSNIKYNVEYNEKYEYYNLWFWLTNEQYEAVCGAYAKEV